MVELPQKVWGSREGAVFAGIFGLVLIGVAVFVWRSGIEPEVEIIRTVDENTPAETTLLVDIEGAVIRPGVYKLVTGQRVGDVIEMAGGFTADADVMWVELHVNKAEIIGDGYKLYIPRLGNNGQNRVAVNSLQNQVSLNYSTQSELESLPGIGEVTAGKIIEGRFYSQIDDLISKKIVTQKVFDQIKDKISL